MERPERGNRGGRKGRKKVCAFCADKIDHISYYRDIPKIRRCLSERAKIIPRRVTGTCAKMFTIAGPVLVMGITASILYGLILWALGLAG